MSKTFQLTPEQQKKLQAAVAGLNLPNINWAAILQIIQAIIGLFQPAPPAPTPLPAQKDQARKALLAQAGCPPDDEDHCCACMEAAELAMESAMVSINHCDQCCQ
jgi:hypothetical protein